MSDRATSEAYIWRRWKVVGLATACLLVVAGAITSPSDGESSPEAAAPATHVGVSPTGDRVDVPGAEGFGHGLPPIVIPDPEPGETPAPAPDPPADGESMDTENSWSPALLRGGLSFLVGFALAYAARAFLRIAVFFLGVWAASLLLLSSLGWIEVHWDLIDAAFEGWSSHIGEQFESARAFVTGSLPSAGMAGLGLVTGIRRK